MLLLAVSVLCASVMVPAIGAACPGCKEALFDPSQLKQKLSMARGYALSIGMLLSVPMVLVGGIALWIVRAQRRMARGESRIDTPKLSR